MPMKLTRREMTLGGLAAAALFAPAVTGRAQAVVLRWGDTAAPTHPSVTATERAAREVKERTAGRIDIQSFPASQLGGSRDMVEAVSSGAMTMVTEGAATLGQFVPPFIIMEAPYVWKDAAHIQRVVKSPLLE